MTVKQLSLRYDGTCSACSTPTPAKTTAWWNLTTKQVTCVDCMAQPGSVPLPPPAPIDHGTAGISATHEAERLAALHDRRAADVHDRDAPDSTTEWIGRRASSFGVGADGEEVLGAALDQLTEAGAVVLHDRSAPKTRGNIDHLVVAPSGLWVIDAKKWSGRIERRTRPRTYEDLLYVNGRNRSKAAGGLRWQVEAVRAALTPIGFGETTVTAVLCFVDGDWGTVLRQRPFKVSGTLVTRPEKLVGQIQKRRTLSPDVVNLIGHHLSDRLPAKH